MLQTSNDGIDATSITSGIENEIKKAGANISKIKKASIKRKVQNFSHESDEGIIEPLLQIEKEKAEIANRSAKYLLNKSKTDSSYERINKSSDNFAFSENTISTPVSSTSKEICTTVKDNQSSTSYICGTAPIHNHMNTNVFGTYDVSKGINATKSQILVEIDGCKSGSYSPSPLIFTTAKIHTDSKSKLMEPVQTTLGPILSTIEGNVVKTLTNNKEHHVNSFSIKSVNQNINKLDTKESQSSKEKPLISATIATVSSKEDVISSKGVPYLNECRNLCGKELHATHSFQDTASMCNKNQNVRQFTNYISKDTLATTTTSISFTTTKNTQDVTYNLASNKLNTDSVPISADTSNQTTTSGEKFISADKNKNSAIISTDNKVLKSNVQAIDFQMEDCKSINLKSVKASRCDISNNVTSASKISAVPGNLENKEITQTVKLKDSLYDISDNTNTVKIPISSASKKLQRQKNAAVDEINETSTVSSSFTDEKSNMTHGFDDKSIKNNEKCSSRKVDYKSDGTSLHEKLSTATKSSLINAKLPPTSITTSVLIVSKSTEDTMSKSKIKSSTDVTNIKPVTCNSFEDVTKTQTKSSTVSTVPNPKDTTILTIGTCIKSESSSKSSTGTTSAMATFSTPDKSNSYSVVPTTSESILTDKCDSTAANTTLPSYIVSTSKTKIGSTLTTSTLKSTTKSLSQKPFVEVVYTSNDRERTAKVTQLSDRSTLDASSSNSANHSNFSQQTKTKTDTFVKDGRA
ncbi:unnamed protein product [Euphydryas editha]|uniref:Uncharacterized protein n=1 Tax=Euphydryas editha TaxID=104508 RepID=A0AAU9U2F5_EUPED|nr:unnamed protein product [Euphydryas editha]